MQDEPTLRMMRGGPLWGGWSAEGYEGYRVDKFPEWVQLTINLYAKAIFSHTDVYLPMWHSVNTGRAG